jgi:hypothetical protein
MRYTVVSLPDADQELAAIWMRVRDKQAVTRAAARIDRLLKFAPERQGEEYGEDRRLVVDGLAAVFRVRPDDCLVEILQFEWLGS